MSICRLPLRALAVLALVSAAATGCATSTIPRAVRYEPSSTTYYTPVSSQVAYRFLDARPAERGGGSARFGLLETTWEKHTLVAREAGEIGEAIRAATVDALTHNGVAVVDGSPLVLTATLKELWVEVQRWGHRRPMVEVEYTLSDEAGQPLWKHTVTSSGTWPTSAWISEAGFVVKQTLGTALRGLGTSARVAFQGDDFRGLMRPGAVAPASGGSGASAIRTSE